MNLAFWKQPEHLRVLSILFIAFVCLTVGQDVLAAEDATGATGGFQGACDNVVKFFKNFEVILKVASVTIVTIAIVFAGYQIAFAHKRISDVAPILIGGLLIGGAAAIASWFTDSWAGDSTSCTEVTSSVFVVAKAIVT